MRHPTLLVSGLWLELTTSAPGVLTGLATTAFPAVGAQTLLQYTTTLNNTFRNLCALPGRRRIGSEAIPADWFLDGTMLRPKIVDITITLSRLIPITISNVLVSDGALRQKVVSRGV